MMQKHLAIGLLLIIGGALIVVAMLWSIFASISSPEVSIQSDWVLALGAIPLILVLNGSAIFLLDVIRKTPQTNDPWKVTKD